MGGGLGSRAGHGGDQDMTTRGTIRHDGGGGWLLSFALCRQLRLYHGEGYDGTGEGTEHDKA